MPPTSNQKLAHPYYVEIDVMRGSFSVAMALYHTVFMLALFYGKVLTNSLYFWEYTPLFISAGFLMLSGLSLYIATQRRKYATLYARLKRSGSIFSLGLLLTAITCVFDFGGKVYFGILHCIGLGTFISFYLVKFNRHLQLLLGLSILGMGIYAKFLPSLQIPEVLFWLYPIQDPSFSVQLDYYPLIPYLGFMLLGMVAGKILYPAGEPIYLSNKFILSLRATWLAPIRLLGRHALLFYLLHTPTIFILLRILDYLGML